MQVLWWLAPAVGATVLAMLWTAWAGRDRGEPRRDDSAEAMQRIQRALAAPMPSTPPPAQRGRPVSHGVVVRTSHRSSAGSTT
jgi:hypothetical protein